MTNYGDITLPPLQGSVSVKTRMGFAVQHLMAAARFSRQCHKVETDHKGEKIDYFFDEIISCCSASIFLSVASLEAYINEIFFDHKITFPNHNEQFIIDKFKSIDNDPILDKYQEALKLGEKCCFSKGSDKEYQDAKILINLRNALVHFKPEWEDNQVKHKGISDGLRGRFEPSAFLDNGDPLFPKRFMSHSCCKWSVTTTLNFLSAFSKRADQPNKFELWETSLVTE